MASAIIPVIGAIGLGVEGYFLARALNKKKKRYEEANKQPNCVLGEWDAEWSECSTTGCDGIKTVRRRGDVESEYGEQCPDDEFSIPCHGPECDEECLLEPWTDWGVCEAKEGEGNINLTCGGTGEGRRYRYRHIYGDPADYDDCPDPHGDRRKQFVPCFRNNDCPNLRDFHGFIKVVSENPPGIAAIHGDFTKKNAEIGMNQTNTYLMTGTGTFTSRYQLIGRFDGSAILKGTDVPHSDGEIYSGAIKLPSSGTFSKYGQPYRWTIKHNPENPKYLDFYGEGAVDPNTDPLSFTVELSSSEHL